MGVDSNALVLMVSAQCWRAVEGKTHALERISLLRVCIKFQIAKNTMASRSI
jgi:hypothetical protein